MKNKLIIAAAGSGKTTYLVNEALKIKKQRVLITTFTEANEKEIKKKIYDINHFIPDNITVQTWFSFLISQGAKPYQSLLYKGKIKGLELVNEKSGLKYMTKEKKPVYYREDETDKHYFNANSCIYSDKLAKFVVRLNEKSKGLVIQRICKIYPNIFIDEVQDMAGYDLDILKLFFSVNSNVLLVGDPRQVTYHTHNEQKNSQYLDGKIADYINIECTKYDVEIDETSLNISHRNNQKICDFANSIFSEYKPCESDMNQITNHDGVFFVAADHVDDYLSKYHPMQLRNNKKTNVNTDYPVKNLGDSKGLTYDRVIIYPTAKMIDWIVDHHKELKAQSRSKLYVGVTRAKYSVAIVYDNKKNINIPGIEAYH